MRNFTTRIQNKANALALRARMALSNQRGDFYISDAVKIIIAVVLRAHLLAAKTLIFNDTVNQKIPPPHESILQNLFFPAGRSRQLAQRHLCKLRLRRLYVRPGNALFRFSSGCG